MSEKGATFLIGITGLSGSGKSWLADKLAQRMGTSLAVIRCDDYYKPAAEQVVDANGYLNFDLPGALDLMRFDEDLRNLCSGRTILVKEYPFENAFPAENIRMIEPAPFILAEGLFLFHEMQTDALFDARIFVEAGHENTLQRRLHRDMTERGIGREKSLYQWEQHVLPAYREYILPVKERSHLVIDNAMPEAEQVEQVLAMLQRLAPSELCQAAGLF